MSRFKEIFGRHSKNKPLDSDSFVIGLFQMVFGVWIMLPASSFAFISGTDPIFHQLGEFPFGLVVFILGLIDCIAVYYRHYPVLKNMNVVGAMYWAVITMGWLLSVPASTAVPVYGFFTVFSIYEFFTWTAYLSEKNLRDNRNIGNI